MKSLTILLASFLLTTTSYSQEALEKDTVVLKIGGALRFNYNLSSWKENQVKRGGDFGFETFRINVDGSYKKWSWSIDQRFYAQDFGGAFLKYGWMQYNIDSLSNLKIGLVPVYWGAKQFNSHSWFFQLPFYLGFEDDHDMGITYTRSGKKWHLDIGFYKNAEELAFEDDAPISDSRYNYDFAGRNKEVNQGTMRFNRKFGKKATQLIGGSAQLGGIWNIDTKEMGRHLAWGAHYDLVYKRWNIKLQTLYYDANPENAEGESRTEITMTAYGFPYQTAAKANIHSFSIAYTLPVDKGVFQSLQFYNNYSYMDKARSDWEDTQMNVLGALISAEPVYLYVDYAMGLHQPWLGPQWNEALTTGNPENGWESRFNINFGLYF